MFTGLIEEVGTLKNLSGKALEISCTKILDGALNGDSIAVNGLCLTIEKILAGGLIFHISPTTIEHSRFQPGEMRTGELINLERALTLSSRLGGHIVLGHVA